MYEVVFSPSYVFVLINPKVADLYPVSHSCGRNILSEFKKIVLPLIHELIMGTYTPPSESLKVHSLETRCVNYITFRHCKFPTVECCNVLAARL
jgi:hypothetical protein